MANRFNKKTALHVLVAMVVLAGGGASMWGAMRTGSSGVIPKPVIIVGKGEVELLNQMLGDVGKRPDGAILLKGHQAIRTPNAYGPGTTFHILAMTSGTDLSLHFGGYMIIFNWNRAPDFLVVSGSPVNGGRHGNGEIPTDQWVDLVVGVNPDC